MDTNNSAIAHCRTCDRQGLVREVTFRREVRPGDKYHVCNVCGSVDVDVMSPEGVAHEEVS